MAAAVLAIHYPFTWDDTEAALSDARAAAEGRADLGGNLVEMPTTRNAQRAVARAEALAGAEVEVSARGPSSS